MRRYSALALALLFYASILPWHIEAAQNITANTLRSNDLITKGPWVDVRAYNNSIKSSVAALPSTGGTVLIPNGTFVSDVNTTGNRITKQNVVLQGMGIPQFNAGYTALVGGTIIQGPVMVSASGFAIHDLGIDSGPTVVAAQYAGVSQEGLNIYDDNQALPGNQWKGIVVENIAVLCDNNSSSVHALLYENIDGGYIKNVQTVHGGAGVVLKARNVNVDGVYSRGHRSYSFLIKSDDYAPSDHINASNIIIDSIDAPVGSTYDSIGVVVMSVGSPATDINFSNVQVRNTIYPMWLNAIGTYIADVRVNNFKIDNNAYQGILTNDNVARAKFSNGTIIGSNVGATIGAGSRDVELNHVVSKNSQSLSFQNNGDNTVFDGCTADTPLGTPVGFYNEAGSSTVRNASFVGLTDAQRYLSVAGTQNVEDASRTTNRQNGIIGYFKSKLVADINAEVGADNVVALWFGDPAVGGTTLTDRSSSGGHTATLRYYVTLAATPNASLNAGMIDYVVLDSSHVWDAADSDAFTFGDGATDNAFSVMIYERPVQHLGYLMGKIDTTTGAEKKEWGFLWDASAGLYLTLYDNSAGGTIGQYANASYMADLGVWTCYAGTYSGSGASSGVKLYRNGVAATGMGDLAAGSYTAMENTSARVGSYGKDTAGAVQYPVYSDMAVAIIFKKELSASQVSNVCNLIGAYK